ncbi:hypothetical protein [Streptomyces sp. NPDC058045]|uniref:hypothetical protein n=1 Tax=Streptomyces sp. NPDC058045 TaxID=3346311 RepID=UPI0036E9307F
MAYAPTTGFAVLGMSLAAAGTASASDPGTAHVQPSNDQMAPNNASGAEAPGEVLTSDEMLKRYAQYGMDSQEGKTYTKIPVR